MAGAEELPLYAPVVDGVVPAGPAERRVTWRGGAVAAAATAALLLVNHPWLGPVVTFLAALTLAVVATAREHPDVDRWERRQRMRRPPRDLTYGGRLCAPPCAPRPWQPPI